MRFWFLFLMCVACQANDVGRSAISDPIPAPRLVASGVSDPQHAGEVTTRVSCVLDAESPRAVGEIANATSASPRDEFVLCVWNLHKRNDSEFAAQLAELARGADVLALQEALLDTPLPLGFGGQHAGSFRWSPESELNGVMTVSPRELLAAQGFRSRARELGVLTPKAGLITRHRLSQGRDLMVINVHALLFGSVSAGYQEQLEDLCLAARDHVGPLILCGDLNTWSQDRRDCVHDLAASLGMDEVSLPAGIGTCLGTGGFLAPWLAIDPTSELDRVFARGLIVREARWLPELDASDHVPLRIVFDTSRRTRAIAAGRTPEGQLPAGGARSEWVAATAVE